MVIYNVTLKVEPGIAEEWAQWMKDEHIPDVMKTGSFQSQRFFKIRIDEEDGVSFCVQYEALTEKDLEDYFTNHAPRLQTEHMNRYANKFVAFRTLLEYIG